MANLAKKTLKQLLSDLERKRDEIFVQIHLAGLDARSEWNAVEVKLRELADIEALRDEARLQAHLAAMDAADELRPITDALDRAAAAASDKVQELPEQARDAKAEAKQILKNLSDRVRQLQN